jgi:hypothetical protein
MKPIVLIHGYSAESQQTDHDSITGIYGDLPHDLRQSYWSFHNLGDLTAFKKGPNQGRAFRHSL